MSKKLFNGRRLLPDAVLKEEQLHIEARREAVAGGSPSAEIPKVGPEFENDNDCYWEEKSAPIGLCLSGGGVRSATFCLGVLQTLAKRNFLRSVDYLSTVSGGGYIGGCLTSLYTEWKSKDDEEKRDDGKKPNLHDQFALSTADQMHHLRRHGDFLITRRGALRRESMRTWGLLLLGMAVMIALLVCAQILFASSFVTFGRVMGGSEFFAQSELGESFGQRLKEMFVFKKPWLILPYAVAGFIVNTALVGVRYWRYRNKIKRARETPAQHGGETNQEYYERISLKKTALLWALFVTLAMVLHTIVSIPEGETQTHTFGLAAITFLGGLLGLIISYAMGPKIIAWLRHIRGKRTKSNAAWNLEFRSFMGASVAVSVYGALLSCGVILVAALLSENVAFHVWSIIGSALALVASRLLSAVKLDVLISVISKLLPVIVGVALFLMFVSSVSLIANATDNIWECGAIAAVALVFCLSLLFIDFNRISLHYFYRDRLAETFLRTEHATGFGLEYQRDDIDLPMKDVNTVAGATEVSPAPLHLVQCSLNLTGSRDLARRSSKSDVFTFSRLHVGSPSTGYVPTESYDDGRVSLIQAMTISAAAVSSSMGVFTTVTRAFLITLFNFRLGYWLPNPKLIQGRYQSPLQLGRYSQSKKRVEPKGLPEPSNRVNWFKCLWQELTGTVTATGAHVCVSDGGHTGDNLGLSSLLQRRCRIIIASDATADTTMSSTEIAAAIRQLFTDENLGVEINLALLREEEPLPLEKPAPIVGRVSYPDCDYDGWIIYIRARLLHDELMPPVAASYHWKNKNFPNESTIDQFFSDDQFEAYRSLGGCLADTVAPEIGKDDADVAEHLTQWCQETFDKQNPNAGAES